MAGSIMDVPLIPASPSGYDQLVFRFSNTAIIAVLSILSVLVCQWLIQSWRANKRQLRGQAGALQHHDQPAPARPNGAVNTGPRIFNGFHFFINPHSPEPLDHEMQHPQHPEQAYPIPQPEDDRRISWRRTKTDTVSITAEPGRGRGARR